MSVSPSLLTCQDSLRDSLSLIGQRHEAMCDSGEGWAYCTCPLSETARNVNQAIRGLGEQRNRTMYSRSDD